jgi:hypothetical protein
MSRIICIGKNAKHDDRTLVWIADWLAANDRQTLGRRVIDGDLDHYDMDTLPEKGDAFQAIKRYRKIDAVIALHLFAIDHRPGFELRGHSGSSPWYGPRYYVGRNPELLTICMKRRIPLIAWGDQPDLHFCKLPVTKHQLIGSAYLYEPLARSKRNLKVGEG